METSPFLIHLPRIFRILVGYNVKSCKFNLWTVCYLISQTIAFGTTIYRFSLHKVPKTDIMEQMTITASLFVVLSGSAVLFRSRNKLGKLIENLLEPIVTSEETTSKMKEFKIYTKWINSIGVFFLINMYLMYSCVLLVLKPVLTLIIYSKKSEVQDFPLPLGWIPFSTESYVVYYIAFIISIISDFGLGAFLTWQMTMSFSALKINLRLKLLAMDVRNFDDIVASRTEYRLMERSTMSLERVPAREKVKISIECRKHLLKELIDRHLKAIGSVRLINDCYSLSALVLVQASSFIAALTLPRTIEATELPIWDLIFVINAGFGALLLIGFPCYFGQMIEDESDNIRRALYDCKWYNQSKSFKTSLRIMMTVATRPLRMTAGGIYPLNRETFSYIMSAFYTYVNFLLALKDMGKVG